MAVVKLYDICSKIGSGATPRGGKEVYCDEGISLIRSQNVLDYSFLIEGLVHINDVQADKLRNVIVEEDDVLLNITGDSVARVCVVDSTYLPARVNQHVCIIRANKKYVQGSYLLYFLQLNKQYLLQLAAGGATRNALTKDMIGNLELELPSLEQQKRVVSLLDDIQAKIKENKKINDNLEQQAQTLFKSWFIDFEPFGNTKPSSWNVSNLGKVSTMGAGGDKPKVVSDTKSEDCPYPIFSNGLSNEGLYGYTNIAKIFEESITVSARGTIGFVCLRHVPYVPIVRLVTLIPNTQLLSAKYLYLWLKQLHISGTGTTQQQLTVPDFQKTEILLPTPDVILSFTDIVSSLFEKIWANQVENSILSNLRDALLPKLMSDELDVSDIGI